MGSRLLGVAWAQRQAIGGCQFFDWHKPLLRMNESRCGAGALNFGSGGRLRRFSGCPIATTLGANPPSGAILRLTTKCGKS